MKHFFLGILLFLGVGKAFTSGADTLSLKDKSVKVIREFGEPFFEKYTPVNDKIEVKRYYSSGKLRMYGFLTQDSLRTSRFTYYYEDGNVSRTLYYKNGMREGPSREYYSSGTLQSKCTYKSNQIVGIKEGYYLFGNLRYREYYLEGLQKIEDVIRHDTSVTNSLILNNDSELKKSPDTFSYIERSDLIQGIPHGDCVYYYKSGKIASEEKYENGKLISFQFYDEDGNKVSPNVNESNNPIYIKPKFKGDYARFLYDKIEYPNIAKFNNITGRVMVKFHVLIDGTVSNVTVVQSAHPVLDEEAVRVIKLTDGKWTPAKFHNLPVTVFFAAPVNFQLVD